MKRSLPSFDETLPLLNQFILELVDAYQTGEINSWTVLDDSVKYFFTPERMDQMEAIIPGWKKMASYTDGVTLTHVSCVFLGVTILGEFQALSPEEQQMVKWIVLFHDLSKFHICGEKDTMHAFRSGILAAEILPTLGFPTTEKYTELLPLWKTLILNANFKRFGEKAPTPDNKKLPEILAGIDRLFAENTPACLITKVVLLHISLDADPNYPTPAPLTEAEIKQFFTPELSRLMRVMMLGDNGGWSLFEPEVHKQQNRDTRNALEKVEELITS